MKYWDIIIWLAHRSTSPYDRVLLRTEIDEYATVQILLETETQCFPAILTCISEVATVAGRGFLLEAHRIVRRRSCMICTLCTPRQCSNDHVSIQVMRCHHAGKSTFFVQQPSSPCTYSQQHPFETINPTRLSIAVQSPIQHSGCVTCCISLPQRRRR